MVDWYIYAKDWSESTDGNSYYHTNGLKTYYDFKNQIDNIEAPKKVVYLHWDKYCQQVDEATIVNDYIKKMADGPDTLPQTIVKWIKDNVASDDNIKLLYIITDGCIQESAVKACMEENKNMIYESVVFHAFNNHEELDISVAAPFLTAQCKLYNNYELMENVDISQAYDYDSININNFHTEFEHLRSYIRLKFLTSASNAQSLNEIEKLKKLRTRLLEEAVLYDKNGSSRETLNELSSKDKNILLTALRKSKFYVNLMTEGFLDLPVHIDKSITTLINYINSTKKSFAFNALKCTQKYGRDQIDEMEIDENITFDVYERIEFSDIILFETSGVPVILLAELNLIQSIIFVKSDKNEIKTNFANFSRLMTCPLFFLLNEKLNDSIEYFYTFEVYKRLITSSIKIGPHTRKPFVGGIILSKEFDDYNDYILAATYFNSNRVKYNHGLFYYVLYKVCQSKNWMDENVLGKFKEYALRRIEKTVCPLGLSSLPLDPQEMVSLNTALWYCIELSSDLFMNDEKNFTHERIRMFYPVVKYIIEILQYFGYELDLELIKTRSEIFRNVSAIKRIFPIEERIYYILKKIFAQDSNGFLLAKIENHKNIRILNYLKLDHKKIIRNSDVIGEVNLNDYVYLTYADVPNEDVKVCEKTMRPYFIVDNHSFYVNVMNSAMEIKIDGNNQIYMEKLTELDFGKVLSLNKLYINYVIDEKTYPTLAEYTSYVHKKTKLKNNLVRLYNIEVSEGIKQIYDSYQKFVKKITVEDFIGRATQSISRINRIKIEKPNFPFNCDDDDNILQFITDEEEKVHLNKK